MPHDLPSEEECCHQALAQLRRDYERAAKPWIDRLVRIQQRKSPVYVVLRAPDGSTHIAGPTFKLVGP